MKSPKYDAKFSYLPFSMWSGKSNLRRGRQYARKVEINKKRLAQKAEEGKRGADADLPIGAKL